MYILKTIDCVITFGELVPKRGTWFLARAAADDNIL